VYLEQLGLNEREVELVREHVRQQERGLLEVVRASTIATPTLAPNSARAAFTRAATATPSNRRAGIFVLASTGAATLNYLYQMAMGRLLLFPRLNGRNSVNT